MPTPLPAVAAIAAHLACVLHSFIIIIHALKESHSFPLMFYAPPMSFGNLPWPSSGSNLALHCVLFPLSSVIYLVTSTCARSRLSSGTPVYPLPAFTTLGLSTLVVVHCYVYWENTKRCHLVCGVVVTLLRHGRLCARFKIHFVMRYGESGCGEDAVRMRHRWVGP